MPDDRIKAKAGRNIKPKILDEPPYEVDDSRLRRYDQRNLIFRRIWDDPNWVGHNRTMEKQCILNIDTAKSGYSRVDYALSEASWTVHDVWEEAFSWERIMRPSGPSLMGEKWFIERYEVEDVSDMTRIVKRAAQFYGADLVGVAELDPRWTYLNRSTNLEPIKIPEEIRYVIVMAVAMDEVGIATSPSCPSAAATGLGYSKMAFTSSILAEFIRNLGFMALPAGNDVALSIPLAIDAGLGQLGRNGLLITPSYGPRVRLCKVLTDLPLEPDKPIDFGVTEYCKDCSLCAEACEANAISKDEEPSWEPVCLSSNIGANKWYVNGERCYLYWCDNGADCSTCISVCPFNNGVKEASSEEFWMNK